MGIRLRICCRVIWHNINSKKVAKFLVSAKDDIHRPKQSSHQNQAIVAENEKDKENVHLTIILVKNWNPFATEALHSSFIYRLSF